LEKIKATGKHSKTNSKPFLIIFLISLFTLFFMLALLPGCRLLFFSGAAYVENNNGARNSKVWEESVISMNNTLKQFAAGSIGRYSILNADKREADAALMCNPGSYLRALLDKYDIAPGGSSLSEGDSSNIYSAALSSFYDNLAEQLKLFKNKTGQSEAQTQKVAAAADDTVKQQEDNTVQTDEQQADEQQTAEQQTGTSTSSQAAGFTATLISLINNARNSNGLPSLSLNPTLNGIAKIRCDDMIARDYFSHVSPDGKDIKAILAESGVMYKITGENLQYCFPPSMAGPELFFNSWMDSEIHRANILGSGYTQIGIALSFNADKAIAALVFLG
jgi:uncharacterized protein YkwD